MTDSKLLLRDWLEEDFPEFSKKLYPLCLNDAGTAPIFFSHPPLARRSARLTASDLFHDRIHRAYVYLASYYFCVDAIIDNHARSGTYAEAPGQIALFLGPLLSTSTHLFSLAVKEQFPVKENEVSTALRALLRENAMALLTETRFKEQPFAARTDEEKDNIVGRANLFIFLFELYWILSENDNFALLVSRQREFVFLMQLGDDLGDWREDFRAGRWTSFLRECFGVLGGIPTERELEEFVYLSGAYERRLARIINGFSRIADGFSAIGLNELASYVSFERVAAFDRLREFTRVKVEFDTGM
jgi:hypothetical protein